jgi:hypothetical protein
MATELARRERRVRKPFGAVRGTYKNVVLKDAEQQLSIAISVENAAHTWQYGTV